MSAGPKRIIRLEVRQELEDILPDTLHVSRSSSSGSRSLKLTKSAHKPVTRKMSIMKSVKEEVVAPVVFPTRVFLYMQLRSILNVPSNTQFKLQVEQRDVHLQKLQNYYSKDRFIDLSLSEYPTFSLTITQDCVENLNVLCDSPVRLTLFRLEKRRKRDNVIDEEMQSQAPTASMSILEPESLTEDAESEEEFMVPVAQGYIDLLQFLSKNRSFSEIKTYIYPMHKTPADNDYGTVLATWHVYTLLPLLKNISFHNIMHISFESIYNFPSEFADNFKEISVNISFKPNPGHDELEKQLLCSFGMFTPSVIENQNLNIKWENVKSREYDNENALGVQTGFKIRIHSIFFDLLYTDGVDFKLDEIDQSTEQALVCNSLHRFILTKSMVHILEQAVAFNQYQLSVEVFKISEPEVILLEGAIDPQVFMYPLVNSCRFAVALQPPPPPTQRSAGRASIAPGTTRSNKKIAGKPLTANVASQPSAEIKDKPTFCIIHICLHTPITEEGSEISKMNESALHSEKLKRCVPIPRLADAVPYESVCENTYREFDSLIETIIQYMVKHNIKTLADGKNALCCHLANISNKVIKLVSCDFNVRFPTKKNREFYYLMTTVYKELVERMYNILDRCDIENMRDCCLPNIDAEPKIMGLITVIKYMHEVGNHAMGKFLENKLKKTFPNHSVLNFSMYLRDVEILNFSDAQAYNNRPLKEKVLYMEYFCEFIGIYMTYLQEMEAEETSEVAFEHLLRKLEKFNEMNKRIIDGWILLHCLYKRCKYQPGVIYTRWWYQNLAQWPRQELPEIPISRWDIYNNVDPDFRDDIDYCFYDAMKMCCTLGLYKFGEIIYAEIANKNTEMERYLMFSTFKILLNTVDAKYPIKTFPTEKLLQGTIKKGLNIQINGSLEYARGAEEAAMKHYERLLEFDSLVDISGHEVGLMRYAHISLDRGDYEKASEALERCCSNGVGNLIVPNFLMGKALYHCGKLDEAITYFAHSTNYKMHLPDAWGYLALIHLKKGENFNALECWKYAKLELENVIGEDIITELAKIPHSDVFLYVDLPNSDLMQPNDD